MSRFFELSRDIQNTRFISQIPDIERRCLIALHRKEINSEQYKKLRDDCSDKLCMLCY